jgi:hypothetical protein
LYQQKTISDQHWFLPLRSVIMLNSPIDFPVE